ncbi:MAG: hypothetical protein MRERV_53c008 [Mycoplasmataceae bacterium RV_VA103A]|nr:MAG: hypothetical protein MRERV_53c008 [Mycoplasmataceae bacterium RV_VA103A]
MTSINENHLGDFIYIIVLGGFERGLGRIVAFF